MGNKCATFQSKGEYEPISRVTMWWGEGENEYYTAGDDTGRTLECENPWATQQIVDNVYEQVKGYVYRPFEATGVEIDPAAELGDAVTIGGIYSVIGSMTQRFDALGLCDIAAKGGGEIEHEYPYKSPQERELKRRVKLGQKYQGVKIDRKDGLTITEMQEDGTAGAKAVFNSKELSFYDAASKRVMYFDPVSGTYKFTGELNVSDNFIVDKDGNVKMNGGINLKGPITWGDNIPNKKRYAASTSGPWHDTMLSGDIYCCDWNYTAEKWGEPYKFKGQDGTNGRPGSDADVTRDNIVLAMLDNEADDGLYTADIGGKQCLGINASAIKVGTLKGRDIEGCTFYSDGRVGVLKLSDRSGKFSDLVFRNQGGYPLFSVEDGLAESGTLSVAGQPIIYVNAGNPKLAPGVEVHATFA